MEVLVNAKYMVIFGTEDISILEKRLIGQKYEKEGLGKF